MVSGCGTPPFATTRCRPLNDPKMIVPSAAHAPPRNDRRGADHHRWHAVASSLIVFSWLSARKPTDFPSGEKKGMYAPSVPGSAVVVS